MTRTTSSAQLKCTHNTAGLFFILLGTLFALVGCHQVYKFVGLSDEQAAAQVAQDQQATQQVIEQARLTAYDIITTTIAAVGSIASGLLAKWLGTERKITTALIQGIESGETLGVKEAVQQKATAAGVESVLHARVQALT